MRSNRSSPSTNWQALVAGLLALAAVTLGFFWLRSERPDSVVRWQPPSIDLPKVSQVPKPDPPAEGYVGSAVCAQCHAAIAESFAAHPMAQSTSLVPGEPELAHLGEKANLMLPDKRGYRVELRGGVVYHHERMVDDQGQEIYDQAVPVHFAIGSGARGKSYVIDRDGLMFMSPISWYTADGGRWDLSPGYERERHFRFDRRIVDECVMCHAGRVKLDPDRINTYDKEQPFLEMAIGCERCHGPGEQHVKLQQLDQPPHPDTSIVNPVKLDPLRRDSVCNQCHLQGKMRVPRYGRSAFDFRPGQLLDEVATVLVEGSGVQGGTTRAVAHVEQMMESVCFTRSAGRMGCISCHDAHVDTRGPGAAEHYRNRCLECHAEPGCSAPLAQREAEANSCIKCHMPRLSAHDIAHASQTDHRVLRKPEVGSLDDPEAMLDVTPVASAQGVLEQWEFDRLEGLKLVRAAEEGGLVSESRLQRADELLRSVAQIVPDDVLVLDALGAICQLRERPLECRQYMMAALQVDPTNEYVLERLVVFCHQQGDFASGLEYVDRLLAINPWHARNYARKADMLRLVQDWPSAVEAAKKGLELDPSMVPMHRFLRDAYRMAGDPEGTRQQAEILRRLPPE